jgi:4-amino-4-deoxy-L-arabinose transferase-like glycosyltransferase
LIWTALNPKSKIQNPKCLLLWLLVLVLFLAWRAQNLEAFSPVNDEGAHLMWARLAIDGFPLYAETHAVQSPLFLEWIGLAFRLAGQTVQAGRWAMLTGFIPLAVALSWLAYRQGGGLAALVALILLGLAPLIFTFSRLVMAEVPATGLAVVSVAWLFVYLDREHRGWLVASGLALGLSFLVKALNPFVIVPIGLLILMRNRGAEHRGPLSFNWSGLLSDALWWGLGLLLPLIAVLIIYDPAALYDQLIAFRRDLRAAISGSWFDTWTQLTIFVGTHWGFWLLAFGGIISPVVPALAGGNHGAEKQRVNEMESRAQDVRAGRSVLVSYPVVWLVWLVAGVVMLLWHTPLFPHHFIVLLPPLILLGAGFVADVGAMWRLNLGSLPVRILLSLIIVAAMFNLPAIVKADQAAAGIVTGGREAEALNLLEAVSQPDDFLMGDSQLLIFMADRRTPPPLGDVALVAIKAGRQTSDRMIDLTQAYQASAVVQWSLRLPWLPEYLAWVEDNYLARRVWDNDHIIYFAPRHPQTQTVPNEQMARLDEALSLRGYQLDRSSVVAGQDLQLKIFWQTDAPLKDDFTIFTQLLDSQGSLVAGWDAQPLGGYLPTSQWPATEIVTDLVQLPLPADLPPGEYTLITGMYLLETLERLTTPTGSDFITLTTIRVE